VKPLKTTPSANPPLFHYHELIIELHPEVYDPAEDSFLLLESVTVDSKDTVLEFGTGCGLLALACARQGARVICTDINPFAVELTNRNIRRNRPLLKGAIETRHGDLFSVLAWNERFTTIIFNPPYLPTQRSDTIGDWLDTATDGGPTGLRVTIRFLQGLHKHLQPGGRAYFIFSSLSNRHTLQRCLKKQQLSAQIIASHRYEGETLDVYLVTPTA